MYSKFFKIITLHSSGGMHLNPAISLAAAIGGRMRTPILAIPMIIGQFIGSLLGAGFCLVSLGSRGFSAADRIT